MPRPSARKAQFTARTYEQARAKFAERAAEQSGNRPMSTASLMQALANALPPDVQIAGEAITGGLDLLSALDLQSETDYLSSRGGGIGQGLPGAIAMKLANPHRPALCVSGDGSAMYTIQTLWTAAHHQIPVVNLILNNGTYRILKLNMNRYRNVAGIEAGRGYANLDIGEPMIDFVNVATGMGLKARRITSVEEVRGAVTEAFRSGEPWLLDVIVDGAI